MDAAHVTNVLDDLEKTTTAVTVVDTERVTVVLDADPEKKMTAATFWMLSMLYFL